MSLGVVAVGIMDFKSKRSKEILRSRHCGLRTIITTSQPRQLLLHAFHDVGIDRWSYLFRSAKVSPDTDRGRSKSSRLSYTHLTAFMIAVGTRFGTL